MTGTRINRNFTAMFTKQPFPPENTRLFDPLLLDYLSGAEALRAFYTYPFSRQGFESIMAQNSYASLNREVLVKVLQRQAEAAPQPVLNNIALLAKPGTYTITTGHQLCLFTGPLYFVYKIISVINLCESLKQAFPQNDFVPVYWMAGEDHDFAEVNHAHLFGKTITWNTPQTGAVGEFSTSDIQPALDELKQVLGTMPHAEAFMAMVQKAYTQHADLAGATRSLVNELFGAYGLIIIDPSDRELKQLFKHEFEKDLFEQAAYQAVNATNEKLAEHYKVQVNPREINIFYKGRQLRERLVQDGAQFRVNNTDLVFTEARLRDIIAQEPEKLSPNVVLRPMYQQKILPNLAYVGGPGELAYWLEYKSMFAAFDVQFPVLAPRQFVTLIDKGTEGKLQKLKLDTADIFKDTEELVKDLVKQEHGEVNLGEAKQQAEALYAQLLDTVLPIDKSLQGAVDAEKQKALNGLAAVEQKLNRALKQKSETDLNQLRAVKGKLFPEGTPQERYDNLGMYYAKYGPALIEALKWQLTYDLDRFEYTVLKEN